MRDRGLTALIYSPSAADITRQMAHPPADPFEVLALSHRSRWVRLALPFVAHILREDADLLTRWRARLTAAFLGAVATLGLLPAVPMLSVGIARGMWTLVVVDLCALLLTFYLLFSRRVSNHLRNLFLTGASFGLGVMSVAIRGPGSTVLGWLFMSVFLAAFLLGPRWNNDRSRPSSCTTRPRERSSPIRSRVA